MNKFRRNAFLLPLVLLILFGIIFFLIAINALEMTPAKDKVAFASGNSIEDMGKFQCSLQKKEATDNKKRTHKIVCTIKGTYERRNRND